jgi:hypothetical protein
VESSVDRPPAGKRRIAQGGRGPKIFSLLRYYVFQDGTGKALDADKIPSTST